MAFIKATKKQAKLRLAVFGTSGSGKTFTALRIATGIGGKIAVIDSERGSASKYSDRFEFDVNELQPANIDNVINAINEAADAGYNVLIIDSLSHSWQELLEEIDKLAKAKYAKNTWGAWSEGTPKQKKLISSILNFNGHIIATMRSKTEWTLDQDHNGRNRPVRVGLSPEAGKGIEYEFDMLIEISTDHIANIIKDRTGKFQDKLIEKPDEKFGREIAEWLDSGEKIPVIIEPEKKIDIPDEVFIDENRKSELIEEAKKRDFPADGFSWLKSILSGKVSLKYYEEILLKKVFSYPLLEYATITDKTELSVEAENRELSSEAVTWINQKVSGEMTIKEFKEAMNNLKKYPIKKKGNEDTTQESAKVEIDNTDVEDPFKNVEADKSINDNKKPDLFNQKELPAGVV